MLYKFQYNSEQEKNTIISQQTGKRLCEEQNIREGNFLIFSDDPVYVTVPEEHLSQLSKRQDDTENAVLAIMDMQLL